MEKKYIYFLVETGWIKCHRVSSPKEFLESSFVIYFNYKIVLNIYLSGALANEM